MTGTEFREARIAAGLSIRQAAARLAVSPKTIQTWESADTVPPRAEAITGSPDSRPYYQLGQIAALVERISGRALPASITQMSGAQPAALLGRLMRLYHAQPADRRARVDQRIEEVMDDLDVHDLEIQHPDSGGFYSLGYYHERGALSERPRRDASG